MEVRNINKGSHFSTEHMVTQSVSLANKWTQQAVCGVSWEAEGERLSGKWKRKGSAGGKVKRKNGKKSRGKTRKRKRSRDKGLKKKKIISM